MKPNEGKQSLQTKSLRDKVLLKPRKWIQLCQKVYLKIVFCSLCLSNNEPVFFHNESNMCYKLIEDSVRSLRKHAQRKISLVPCKLEQIPIYFYIIYHSSPNTGLVVKNYRFEITVPQNFESINLVSFRFQYSSESVYQHSDDQSILFILFPEFLLKSFKKKSFFGFLRFYNDMS